MFHFSHKSLGMSAVESVAILILLISVFLSLKLTFINLFGTIKPSGYDHL